MKTHPILFNGDMVRAILEGRKSQTRRILKGSTEHKGEYNPAYLERHKDDPGWKKICPYGQPGDLLWVREGFTKSVSGKIFTYRADYPDGAKPICHLKWKPSIHMPRIINRITLEIKNIRVERLQDISEEDAEAEGVKWFNSGGVECPGMPKTPLEAFKQIWSEINGSESWNENPWLWTIQFETHLCNIDEYLKQAA